MKIGRDRSWKRDVTTGPLAYRARAHRNQLGQFDLFQTELLQTVFEIDICHNWKITREAHNLLLLRDLNLNALTKTKSGAPKKGTPRHDFRAFQI